MDILQYHIELRQLYEPNILITKSILWRFVFSPTIRRKFENLPIFFNQEKP